MIHLSKGILMKTLRIAALTTVFAAFGLMTGCDLFGTNSDATGAPLIAEFESANFNEGSQIWSKNDTIEFYGKATDENSVTSLSLDLVNASGTVVKNIASRTTSGTSVKFGKSETVKLTIVNPGDWATTGSYTVRLTAKNQDGQTGSKDMVFKYIEGSTGAPTPTGTALTEIEQYEDGSLIRAGSQGSSYFSFLSIQEATTYTSGTITDWTKIDLVFFASTSGTPTLYSPAEAKSQGLGSLTTAPVVATKIWKTTSTYESITTAEALASAITAAKTATPTAVSATAVSGGVYLIELSTGKQAVLKVTNLVDNGKTTSGKYNIDITLKWSDNQ